MVYIATQSGTALHTGSVCGKKAGTLIPGQSFVKINGSPIFIEGAGIMDIPNHNPNPDCAPSTPHNHQYPCDTLAQSYVKINGVTICMVNDFYEPDATHIDSAGQSLVNIT